MRAFLLALMLAAAGCYGPSQTLDNWLLAADSVGADEATEAFLEELESRLHEADADLIDEQDKRLYPILLESTEKRRAILERHRGGGFDEEDAAVAEIAMLQAETDMRVERLLNEPQIPVYRQLMAETAAWFQDELRRAAQAELGEGG